MSAYSRQRGAQDNKGLLGVVFQGVAAGIGLASEAYQHNQEKKQLKKEQAAGQETADREHGSELADGEAILDAGQVDELTWDLDEAQRDIIEASNPSQVVADDIPELARSFIEDHRLPEVFPGTPSIGPTTTSPPRLDLPVILTQRRPKARDRGFIRAYAPILAEVGIDKATFLEFVDKLNLAVQPEGWINAINLAGLVGMAVPQPFSLLVGIAVKKIASAAKEVNSRSKTNNFLDKVNAEFFRPRGLVCLVMTWKPEAESSPITNVDFQGRIVKAAGPAQGTLQKLKRSIQPSSMAEAFEWPDVAPLVFPDLEEGQGDSAKQKNVMKRAANFVGDYRDKRALAKWAGSNPESNVANMAPAPEFKSRYSDPNHPASSGDPLALLTGGYIQLPTRQGLAGRGRGGPAAEHPIRGLLGSISQRGSGPRSQTPGGRTGLGGMAEERAAVGPLTLVVGAKKLLQKDVLYLVVVNYPTEQELAEAVSFLE